MKHFYRLATKKWWLSDIKTLYLSFIYKLWASLNQNNMEDAENPLKSRQQFKTK